MAVNSSGARVWTPYKEIYAIVHNAITKKQVDATHDLEVALRQQRPSFLSLLQNPGKDVNARNSVKKATTEGLTIQGQPGTQTLTQQFIDEALILSDLFNLNEYAAVELLMAGENQLPNFPGLTRGLVAVILYYDGRRNLVSALRSLIQARRGRTWALDLGEELVRVVTQFTNQLMEDGLTNKIIALLNSLDVTQELDMLQKERALGYAKHRKQVTDLFKEIKLLLAECLYCWAAQTPLNKQETLRVMTYLKTTATTSADGTLDSVACTMLMTLLYCIDVSVLDQENSEEVAQMLPIFTDNTYIHDLHQEIVSEQNWVTPGLKRVVQFAWAQTLRKVSQQANGQAWNEFCEDDEYVVDQAIQENVFFFLRDAVVGAAGFHNEEFFVRRIHVLLTDFIVQMPLKVKEMRNHGDEAARIIMAHAQEGLPPPPSLKRDFEEFMRLIADLYVKDPLDLELSLEFWIQPDSGTDGTYSSVYHYRPPQRQVSLSKFVRLAGDLLPASLYVPYINMLTGLANGSNSARQCFNLLKANSMTGGGHASSVSWDHFFSSLNQYYASLRQEVPSSADTSHPMRRMQRGITQQELEGLIAVLQLTRQITEQDEHARVALVENQQWLPVVLLFGLLSCSVPPSLKAELLLTLAALAKSAEIAASLWQSLEVSQILPTHEQTSQKASGGIQVELDEIEARNEEYPMTRAFLELVNSLTNIPVPAGLGAGYRAPGFDPYLDFLKTEVFLKFSTRAYKNAAEKWEVAASVLEVLYKLLRDHEIQPTDFIDVPVEMQGGGTTLANKPPGHNLMMHMLNDGGMLKMILQIINQGNGLLEQYTDFPGKENLERTTLLCLKMIEVTLEKQTLFLDLLRDSGASIMVSPMDKLLLGINPRSGKADHLVNITKYVTYNSFLLEHALSAVRVLFWVCQSSLIQPELVGMFTADQVLSQDLLHGFVECLDTEDVEEKEAEETQDQDDSEPSTSYLRNATCQTILRLLLHTLDQPAPNINHYLLGFETRKPVSKTNLQEPGVLGSPRTCLHSILDFLDRGIGTKNGPLCLQESPVQAELAYHLIFALCVNKDTSSPTMRYLRSSQDFLYRHLQHLPFMGQEYGASGAEFLNHQSWLLKSVALELRLTSLNRQRSNVQRLLNLILEDSVSLQEMMSGRPDSGLEGDISQFEMERTGYSFMNMTQFGQSHAATSGGQTRRKILQILDSIDFSQLYPAPMRVEIFEPSVIEQVIKSCEEKNDQGITFCNVKNLHRILINELNTLQGAAAAGQRPLLLQEIQTVLEHVVKRNHVREIIHAKRHGFESWRQVVEIILTACPEDLLTGDTRQNMVFELLQELFRKISEDDALSDLTSPVAGVILILIANLRQCFIGDQSESPEMQQTSQYVSMLDRSAAVAGQQSTVFGQQTGSRTLYLSSLQVVLKGLIEHILRSSGGQQRVRANLYGSLLYYLQIAQKPKALPTQEIAPSQTSVSSMLTTKESEFEKLGKENLATILSYGENFMEVTCRDACDGHDVGRMLALSCIDAIVSIDKHQVMLSFLTSKGYLQHIVDSLLQDNEQLQGMLHPAPEPLKALYIYESKMCLLTRLAETITGATALLRCGVMARLAECTFFDLRPESDRPPPAPFQSVECFIPSMMARYRQMLFPALKLCLAIMTSLGIENREAANKVLQFIVSHADVFNTILRDRHSTLSLPVLEELSLTTAVVSRAAAETNPESEFVEGDTSYVEFQGHLSRIQRQLIALLPKYCLTSALQRQLKNMESQPTEDGKDVKAEIEIATQQIATNVVQYCRAIVSKSGTSAPYYRVLFAPSLVEATARDGHDFDDHYSSVINANRPLNLGIVVYQLKQCASHFTAVYDAHKQYLRKVNTLNELSNEELREISGTSTTEKLSSQQRQQSAKRRLTQLLAYKAQELQLYSYIIENCLFILWRHLDYYLIHCVPTDQGQTLFQLHARKQAVRRLQDFPGAPTTSTDHLDDFDDISLTSGVSQEDLVQFKAEASACINEALFKKLQEIDQCYGKVRSRYGFTEAMIRRIKRLIRLHT